MKIDMVMPQMGESITEATISKWLKSPGDAVEKDETILEISTDKVDSEIPSPASGTLSEVLFSEGDVVPVKEKIAVIDTDGDSSSAEEKESKEEKSEEPPPAKENESDSAPPKPKPQRPTETSRFYSPLVKSLAEKHGVDLQELDDIEGSGTNGRVTKEDFLSFLENRGSRKKEAPSPASRPEETSRPAPKKQAPETPAIDWGNKNVEVIPMDNMRQAIAEHMVRSKQTSPHVYSVQELDVSKISAWRNRYKGEFRKREGFNLSYTPFFLEAAVKGLQKFPHINASVDGNKIILKRNINLGCAVALGNTGLIVPVIKQAEEKNFVGIARALNDLATRARDKKLVPDEVMDGTFTVTNPGVFGTIIGTPIINQPQVAILCLGAIKKRPVVIDDMIAIRETCFLTLSYDHRIVDGALGGQYLAFLRDYLENWDMERELY